MPSTRANAFCSDGRVHQLYASSRTLSRVGVAQARGRRAHSSNTRARCKSQRRLVVLGVACGDIGFDRSYRVFTNFGCPRNPANSAEQSLDEKSSASLRTTPKILLSVHSNKDR